MNLTPPAKKYKGRPCVCWVLMVCCSVLFIILLVLTILVGSFSLPDGEVKNLQGGSPPFEIIRASNDSPLKIQMNLVMTTEIRNDNFYGITINDVVIEVYYSPTKVLLGSVQKDTIDFKANQVFIEEFPITFLLQPSERDTYDAIISRCGPQKGLLELTFDIKVALPEFLRRFGIPKISFDYNTPCPVDLESILPAGLLQ